jgi:hypothetical protein
MSELYKGIMAGCIIGVAAAVTGHVIGFLLSEATK